MHHSDQPPDFLPKELLKELGATHRFPEGRLTDADEGELTFAVTVRSGKVVVAFGKPVSWFGMGADQADLLADLLRQRAAQIRAG